MRQVCKHVADRDAGPRAADGRSDQVPEGEGPVEGVAEPRAGVALVEDEQERKGAW